MGALFNPVLAQQSGPAWEDVLVWSTNGFQEGEIAVNKSSNPEGKPLDAVRTDRFSLQQGLRETVEAILFPIVIVPINQFRGRPGTSTGSDCLRLTSILHAPGAWCSDPTMFEGLLWGLLDMFHLVLMATGRGGASHQDSHFRRNCSGKLYQLPEPPSKSQVGLAHKPELSV